MRNALARRLTLCAVALTLAACGQHPRKDSAPAPVPPPTEIAETGWLDADTAEGPGIVFRDDTSAPGFSIRCVTAGKQLKVMAPNPLQDPPIDRERATLLLGAETFEAPVSQTTVGAAPLLVIQTAVTPQLLIALGDAKTARLLFRDGSSETGVDEEGKVVAFAQRCARMTGVEPAL